MLRESILTTIAPPLLADNKDALENGKKKRKIIQGSAGEVLTREEVAAQLFEEQEERSTTQGKKAKVTKKKENKSSKDKDAKEKENEPVNNDDDQCNMCHRYKLKKKWIQCDICDMWICGYCQPKNIDCDDDFYCQVCIAD